MTFCMIDFAYIMQSFLLASECRQCLCIWLYFSLILVLGRSFWNTVFS